MGFLLRMWGSLTIWKSVFGIYCINKVQDGKHIVILIDTEGVFEIVQALSWLKKQSQKSTYQIKCRRKCPQIIYESAQLTCLRLETEDFPLRIAIRDSPSCRSSQPVLKALDEYQVRSCLCQVTGSPKNYRISKQHLRGIKSVYQYIILLYSFLRK